MHRKTDFTTQMLLIYSFKLRLERARKWGISGAQVLNTDGQTFHHCTVWAQYVKCIFAAAKDMNPYGVAHLIGYWTHLTMQYTIEYTCWE